MITLPLLPAMPKLKEIIRETTRQGIFRTHRWLGKYQPVWWTVGHARSGTTWLAELINHRQDMRELFEPFHPQFNPELQGEYWHRYLEPGANEPQYAALADRIFCGAYTEKRVDERNQRWSYQGLLVKDIFANLLLKWAAGRFPSIKKVWIVRHPCAVAASKLKWYHLPWMKEPKEFLDQAALTTTYLEPFRDHLLAAETDFEKTILIWAVTHYVPFQQLVAGDVCLIFYEDIVAEPEREIPRLCRYLFDVPEHAQREAKAMLNRVRDSSRTGTFGGVEAQLERWRGKITSEQTKRMVELLRPFGLHELYNEASRPRREFAAALLAE